MHSYFMTTMNYRKQAYTKTSTEKEQNSYDQSVQFSKFFYFLRAPVLIFKLEYPKTEKFRLRYLLTKSLQSIFHLVFFLLYEFL